MKHSDLRNNPQSPARQPFQKKNASTLISFNVPVNGWEIDAAWDLQIHLVRSAAKGYDDPTLLQQTQVFIQTT
jgi:hypothetical protein